MKVMINFDIEGIAGIAHWDEALKSDSGHAPFRNLMIDDAFATCRGAQAAGAAEIILRDAHEAARNLDFPRLPGRLEMVCGWSGHSCKMMQDLDDSVDALVMVGRPGTGADLIAYDTIRLQTDDIFEIASAHQS